MPDIPTNEPTELRAGLTWQWEREFADYPASVWTLKYWFKKTGSSGANFSLTATALGDTHSITHSATDSATRTAGDYTWSAIVTAGSEAFEVDRGTLKVLPRYDQAANLDDRSHARKTLEAIEAVIEGRATKDQQEYSIMGRSLKRTPIDDLLKLKDHYSTLVASEEAQARLDDGKTGGSRLLARL